MAPLDRALALQQVDEAAVVVGQDLDLDVTRTSEVTLQDHDVVAEGGPGLAARGEKRRAEVFAPGHRAHALATAAARRLDHHGPADALRLGQERGVLLVVALVSRNDGNPGRSHEAPRALLVPHGPVHGAGRTDEGQPGLCHGVGEGGVLAQEAVAGMDGVGPRLARSGQQGAFVQVGSSGLGGADGHRLVRLADVERAFVHVRIHGGRGDAHGAAGAGHAHRDLAAVGDEDLAEEGHAPGECSIALCSVSAPGMPPPPSSSAPRWP